MYAKTGGLDGVYLKQQINFGGSGGVLVLGCVNIAWLLPCRIVLLCRGW